MIKLFFIIAALFLFSCHSKPSAAAKEILDVQEIAVEQMIPKELMLNIENEYKEEFKAMAPLYSFITLQVLFNGYSENVLRLQTVQYNFPKGGGTVDLKKLVVDEGSFYMSFPAEQFDEKNELVHLYYISNSPKSKIGAEHFGMGCGKWTDLKSDFKKFQNQDFLKLNTNELRYLKVLAGTYVFVFRQTKNIYMTQLTVTDSRYLSELCLSGNGGV
jgi:hypothetical protein